MMITTMVDLAVDLTALEHNYGQLGRLCTPQVKMLGPVSRSRPRCLWARAAPRGPEARRRRPRITWGWGPWKKG